MEDFVKYLADIIEFLVGGVVMVFAIVVSAYLFIPEQLNELVQVFAEAPNSIGTLITLTSLGLVYGLGIIFEGLSRALVEWKLDRITVKRISAERTLPVLVRPNDAEDIETPSPSEPLPQAELVIWATGIREDYRRRVEADVSGLRTITTQLSRLRVERTFLLASLVITLALVAKIVSTLPDFTSGYPIGALIMLLVTLLMYHLVNERFRRYVDAIVREYNRLSNAI